MNMLVPVASAAQRPTDGEIIRATGRGAFHNGGFYVASGRVRQVTVSPDGMVIEAATKGSASRPYQQHVVLRQLTGVPLEIRGTCTCPVGFNCKHVAAAVIAGRRTQRLQVKEQSAASVENASSASAKADPPLPFELNHWLTQLDRVAWINSGQSTAQRQQLIYVLSGAQSIRSVQSLEIRPFTAMVRKDGQLGAGRSLTQDRWTGSKMPDWAEPADHIILNRLAQRRSFSPSPEDAPPDTLRRILDTGRARWANVKGPELTEGPARAGRLHWHMNPDDGSQVPAIALNSPAEVIQIPDPWVSCAGKRCGRAGHA